MFSTKNYDNSRKQLASSAQYQQTLVMATQLIDLFFCFQAGKQIKIK